MLLHGATARQAGQPAQVIQISSRARHRLYRPSHDADPRQARQTSASSPAPANSPASSGRPPPPTDPRRTAAPRSAGRGAGPQAAGTRGNCSGRRRRAHGCRILETVRNSAAAAFAIEIACAIVGKSMFGPRGFGLAAFISAGPHSNRSSDQPATRSGSSRRTILCPPTAPAGEPRTRSPLAFRRRSSRTAWARVSVRRDRRF